MRFSIVAFFCLLLAVFVLEFSLGVSISNMPGLSLKNILIYGLLLALFIVNHSLNKPIIGRNRVNMPIVLFILYCLASLLTTAMFKVVPDYATTRELILFKSYMDPYILFIVAYSVLHDERSIKSLLLALVVTMAVFVAITVLSSFGILSVQRVTVDERWGRTSGAFAEANQFAAYLVAFLPLLGAFMITAKSKLIRAVLAGILLAALYVLLLSGSRGGLLALFIGAGVYYLLYSRHALPKSVMNLTMVYVAVLLVLVLVFFTLPEQTAHGLVLKLSGKFTDVAETDYSSGRLETWGKALKLFMHSPLFGTGWRTFIPLIGWNSHSDYVLFLVTTGVVGLYLFVLIYVRTLNSAMECRRLDPGNRHFYNAFIAGFVPFMVAMVFVNIYNPSYFVLLYAALVLKLGMLRKPDQEQVKEGVVEPAPAAHRILRRRQAGGTTGK